MQLLQRCARPRELTLEGVRAGDESEMEKEGLVICMVGLRCCFCGLLARIDSNSV